MDRKFGRGAVATSLALIVPLIAAVTSASGAVVINEVESDGAADFVELFNTGASTVDISGYVIDDNTDGNTFTVAGGTTVPANGFYVTPNDPVGLGSADAARLFAPGDLVNPVDSYAWTSHAVTTFGRCPDGTGAFIATNGPTPGAANACPAVVEDKCIVPRIAKGKSRARVRNKLTAAGCRLGRVTKRFSRRVKRGKLIRLKVRAGTELASGARVPAVFSKGKRQG